MEIQQTSFKMTILLRYSSYRNYMLRYMCFNFLGNRPQADGEWKKLHSHAETDCKEDTPLTLPFCIVCFPLTVDNSDMN
jgi:hypothetical protein